MKQETIFDKIKGHLLILVFYRAQTRVSKALLRKKAIKFEAEVLDTPTYLHNMSNMIELKVKNFETPAAPSNCSFSII